MKSQSWQNNKLCTFYYILLFVLVNGVREAQVCLVFDSSHIWLLWGKIKAKYFASKSTKIEQKNRVNSFKGTESQQKIHRNEENAGSTHTIIPK